MLEIQNGQSSLPIKMGSPALRTISAGGLTRANMASGFFGDKILVSGGFGQPANPFPNNATMVTLNANRDAITATTNPAGYDGTSTHSSPIGDRLWIAMGHDGSYRNYLKSRTISTGAVVGGNSAACPGPTRINSIIFANGADEIYYGGGYNPSGGWLDDWWLYKPSNNSWTPKASLGGTGKCIWFSEAVKGADGLIYGGVDYPALQLNRYNPVANTWSKTANFGKFVEPAVVRPFSEAATAVVGKYVLFIQRGQLVPMQDKLYCYRYDTVMDSWDALEMPGRVPLFSARASIEPAKDLLYLYGGALAGEGTTAFDKSLKNSNLYVYRLSDFAKD